MEINEEDFKNPTVIKVCHCHQCRAVKARKKGKTAKYLRRLLNKKRRKNTDKVFNFYWA